MNQFIMDLSTLSVGRVRLPPLCEPLTLGGSPAIAARSLYKMLLCTHSTDSEAGGSTGVCIGRCERMIYV
jgi:hypothetical protein